MKIEIDATVDDELRSELVLQLRDLICALRLQGAEVSATLQGAAFEVECHEDDDALDGYYDPAIESVPVDESWDEGDTFDDPEQYDDPWDAPEGFEDDHDGS